MFPSMAPLVTRRLERLPPYRPRMRYPSPSAAQRSEVGAESTIPLTSVRLQLRSTTRFISEPR